MIACVSALVLCLASVERPASGVQDEGAGLALAAGVSAWADRNGDADAMMIAAELVRTFTRGGLPQAEGDLELGADKLFDQAGALTDDPTRLDRLEQRRAIDPRGITRALGEDGPIARLMLIAPDRPLSFSLTARGSQQALLHVGPRLGGDLDVVIADDRGRSVCIARAAGRPVLCSWRPAFTTTYRVVIRALSAAPVTTVITSN